MSNAVAEREPLETSISPNRDGQRILIIDDEAGIRDSLETLLGFDEFEYLALFLWLAIAGPGVLSIDHWLLRWFGPDKRLAGESEAA